MAKEGMLQELDHSKLSNFKQIPANLLNKEFDPNNKLLSDLTFMA